MTTAEKITLAIHAAEALAVVVFMAFATVKFSALSTHADQSQQAATMKTVATMGNLQTAINQNSQKFGNLILAGTALLDSATKTSDSIRAEVKPTAQSAQDLANSAAGTAQQATATLKTAQGSIAAFQPLETAARGEIQALHATTLNLNAQITSDSPYVHNVLVSASGILKNGNGITSDAYAQYNAWLHPPKCKHFGCRFQRYVLGNLPVAYHAIQAGDALHDLFGSTKISGTVRVKH